MVPQLSIPFDLAQDPPRESPEILVLDSRISDAADHRGPNIQRAREVGF